MHSNGSCARRCAERAAATAAAGGKITTKAWGTTQLVYLNDRFELTRLVIHRGGYSSRHKHRFKANTFVVAEGRLAVVSFVGSEMRWRVLTPGDGPYTVPARVEHRFVAFDQDTVVYEVYSASAGRAVSRRDIVRYDRGGRLENLPPEFTDEQGQAP